MTSKKVFLWWTLYSAEENEFGGETMAKETMAKAISCRSAIHTLVCAAKWERQNNFMKIHSNRHTLTSWHARIALIRWGRKRGRSNDSIKLDPPPRHQTRSIQGI